jgi:hypothetical protein
MTPWYENGWVLQHGFSPSHFTELMVFMKNLGMAGSWGQWVLPKKHVHNNIGTPFIAKINKDHQVLKEIFRLGNFFCKFEMGSIKVMGVRIMLPNPHNPT